MGSYGANRSRRAIHASSFKADVRKSRIARENREKRTLYLRRFEPPKTGAYHDFPSFELRILKIGRRLTVEMGAGVDGYTCQESYEGIPSVALAEITAWADALEVGSLRDLKAGFKARSSPGN